MKPLATQAQSDDVDELLATIEDSYHIKFDVRELESMRTFGELCDVVIRNVNGVDMQDCTSQQAFYKLRTAICKVNNIAKDDVLLTSTLDSLFPKNIRRSKIGELNAELGFTVKILQPSIVVTLPLLFTLLFSFGYVFFNVIYGGVAFVSAIILMKIASKYGREFTVSTVRELAQKMSMEYYHDSRRNPQSFNAMEIRRNLENLFIEGLMLDINEIKPETRFY